MSAHNPSHRDGLQLANARQIADMEDQAYRLLAPEPTEAIMGCGIMSALGNRATIQVMWEENDGIAQEGTQVGICISDTTGEPLLESIFGENNDALRIAFDSDQTVSIFGVLSDLLSDEKTSEEIREVLRFYCMVLLADLELEEPVVVRAFDGIDEDGKLHIADTMRDIVKSKQPPITRSRSYQAALGSEQGVVVQVHHQVSNIADLLELEMTPELSVELVDRGKDTGLRYLAYPDHDHEMISFIPSMEDIDDLDDEEPDEEIPDMEFEAAYEDLMDGLYAPLQGDVKRLRNVLSQCVIIEALNAQQPDDKAEEAL
ncbi:hypothetical protein E6P97_00915 [Patescibacteria group bacterium]|nr:MAG: hypothetical protein E6P97_00915 [Patescibacteria group bacterium]